MKTTSLRRTVAIVLVALLLLQGLAITAYAGPPAGTWVTGIQVQNVDTVNNANITVTFYWAAGTASAGQVAHSFTDTILAGKSKTYYVPNIGALPTNFVGSVVVSSDVEVAAILNTTKVAAGTSAEPKRIGSAVGVSVPSTTVYAPYLRKDYYGRNSYIAVQNTSGADATAYVTYRDATGAAITAANESAVIGAYSTKIFYQNDNTNLPAGFSGSAVITSTAPLAVVANNANAGTSVGTAGFESYNGFASSQGATKIFLPKLTVNYSDYQSSFTIQNAGTVAANMTITYTFGTNTWTKTSGLIQPGAAWSVYLATSSASGIPAGTSGPGSAVVTSSQPMVALVTEVKSTLGYSVISVGVADGQATDTVLFPKFDSEFSNYNSGIQIQNVGTTTTTVTLTFSKAGSPDVTKSAQIGPGKSTAWYGPNLGLGAGWTGSVVAVSSGGVPIAGIHTNRNSALLGDTYTAYNGIAK